MSDDDSPPGDPWNNPKDRKVWEQQGWVIERETAFKKTPGIDLTQPLSDEPPPLSEEHQRQVCRFLKIPYEPEKIARTKAYVRWKRLNKAAMDAEDRKRFGLIEVLSPAPARRVATPASPRVYLLPAPAPQPPEPVKAGWYSAKLNGEVLGDKFGNARRFKTYMAAYAAATKTAKKRQQRP
jgi:hypothetical protein